MKSMIGVDLSTKMLALAAEKNIYSKLLNIDFNDALALCCDLDLIIAADSMVYCGDLSTILCACKKALKKSGVFAFTLEKTSKYPFVLQQSARYAHSAKYIDELIAQSIFTLLCKKEIILRNQKDALIEGYLYVLRVDKKK